MQFMCLGQPVSIKVRFYFTLLATALATIVAGAKRTLYGAKQQESNMLHLESSFSCSDTFEVFFDAGCCAATGFFFGGMNIFDCVQMLDQAGIERKMIQ
jgi:hypothetical protein